VNRLGEIVGALLWVLLTARTTAAFVSAPVGGRPGEVDIAARVGFERGKVEPNENTDSFQKARWNMYTVEGGWNTGALGPFRDFTLRLSLTYLTLPAERNDPSKRAVTAAQCSGQVVGDGLCEFYPEDDGFLITPFASVNFIHVPDFNLGAFVQGTLPTGLDLARFTLPRVDFVAGGVHTGVRFAPWLGYVGRIYVGSGARLDGEAQNAAVALTQAFALEAERWLLPWKAGVLFGPYFEGDLNERFDARYDRAYTADFPDRRDRIRSVKFGFVVLPHFRVTDRLAVELGYVQKLFGYDAPATQLYTIGLRQVF
jgi:hypothetical protein